MAGTRPRGRARGRGAEQSRDLTRSGVIDAGIVLLDREGLGALTMRRLADELGVTAMALYNHVSDRRDLAHALAARVLGAVRFEDLHEDWRDQIAYCFGALRAICLRHPWMPRLLEMEDAAPAAVFAPMDVSLRALAAAGVQGQDALRAYFTLVGFTLSHASYQVRGPIPDLEPSDRVRSERLAGQGYLSIDSLASPGDWDFDAAFEFGLMLIVRGIEVVGGQR